MEPDAENHLNFVRVSLGEIISVMEFNGVDAPDTEYYTSVDSLPNWVQERLSLLMMIDATPPTEFIAGVGRRINERVFWIANREEVSR